jgi:hypothetical protein
MEPELGLDRSDYLAELTGKRSLLELGHHLPSAKPAEVTAILAGRAGREPLGNRKEVFTVIDAF